MLIGRSGGWLGVAVLVAGLATGEAFADAKEHLSGHGGLAQPLQRVIRVERARGPVFVMIPVAYVFGLVDNPKGTYCSPSIRAVNSSNAPIEELVFGIDFKTRAGQEAGSAIVRFDNIKIGRQDTQYFYQLSVSNCHGLEGQVSVVRCTYTSGEECVDDVRVVEHGTIPLRPKSP
ncbi:MAG: hypothetical protein RBT86_06090 [Azospira sp.]|jgi:hypothetical protein|nr:hypothetical protein [Azospira sp.]